MNVSAGGGSVPPAHGGWGHSWRQEAVWWPAEQLQQAGQARGQHHRDSHRPPQAQALPAHSRGEYSVKYWKRRYHWKRY